ncbi:AAA family ATPase [Acinetobacter sp. ANC 4639]
MNNKLYYWAESVYNYTSDNEKDNDKIIEIKRLNFFIGKNNAGKSRFLRNIFSSKINLHCYQIALLRKLLSTAQELKNNDQYKSLQGSQFYNDFFTHLDTILKNIKSTSENSAIHFEFCLQYLNRMGLLNKFGFPLETNTLKNQFSQQHQATSNFNLGAAKFYLPVLRGMRPVTEKENTYPYIKRTQNDYFKDQKIADSFIITGESLYNELKIHLLGEPEQRDLIRTYEEKLSQYFFDNETVSLIPKHDQDVVNIKIGKDKQFPISQLGDGLQQAIILTFEAFTQNKDIHAFFIEEPELHMHAGMVRQLMNFYLNETQHYYFFTTHSNHLLDMADESDQVIIQKFVKEPNKKDTKTFDFNIYRCDRDHELLTSLGIRPSSVYLANCTIWVEGVTDRMYLSKLMDKYLKEIENSEKENFKTYKSFMPNFHYAFIEYAGGNITHWSFMDDYPSKEEALEFLERNKGLTAKAISKNILLLADGDNEGKAERLKELETELHPENVYLLRCKEIENTLSPSIIYKACLIKFHGIQGVNKKVTLNQNTINNLKQKGFNKDTSEFNISNLSDSFNFISNDGIGKIIDDMIRIDQAPNDTPPRLFSEASGTIADKVGFCEICKVLMTYEDWQLTQEAKDLCKKIFEHIKECNR